MKFENKKKILFLTAFTALALICYQINFSSLLGTENQSFTLFQFIGPIGAGIFSPVFGAISVITVELINAVSKGSIDLFGIARMFPMVFAAIYFGTKTKHKAIALVPLASMLLFWAHPIGAQAWAYPLYWLIPIATLWKKDNLLLRSLGTTFTAHAVGSVAFLYAFSTVPALWWGLIPIVFIERMLFALGISISFVAANTIVSHLGLPFMNVDKRYVLPERFKNLTAAPSPELRSQ
ncbi:hypothetical protein K8R43_01295 [archaeon]|nr:hypothetical protein [archaeon]